MRRRHSASAIARGGTAGVSVAPGENGSVYFAGVADGLVDFDPGAGIATRWAAPGESGFILKLAGDGSFRWATTLDATPVSALASTPDGGVIALGGADSGFVSRFSTSGIGLWTATSGVGSITTSLAAGANGFVFAGSSDGTGDFDPGTGVDVVPGPHAFVSRFDGF